jgi:hypothetical protein
VVVMRASMLWLVVAVAVLMPLAPASAHDSLSPPGAPHNWLPKEDWSAFHWSPFDELRLAHLLGITHRELYDYQSNDHQTLAELAVARGIDPVTLREQLLAPWKGHVSRAQLRVLRNHTSRMLTQGHLAQHMFWHPFHSPAYMRQADKAAHELFGVSIRTYRRLRRHAYTEVQIAARGGRTPQQLRRAITRHVEMEAAMGVRLRLTPRSQAARMLARQKSLIACWMSKPLPEFDPDIPFGDPFSHHGPHDRNSKIGIVFPKPAAGCWLPLVPLD